MKDEKKSGSLGCTPGFDHANTGSGRAQHVSSLPGNRATSGQFLWGTLRGQSPFTPHPSSSCAPSKPTPPVPHPSRRERTSKRLPREQSIFAGGSRRLQDPLAPCLFASTPFGTSSRARPATRQRGGQSATPVPVGRRVAGHLRQPRSNSVSPLPWTPICPTEPGFRRSPR